jgi:hypothetical protein
VWVVSCDGFFGAYPDDVLFGEPRVSRWSCEGLSGLSVLAAGWSAWFPLLWWLCGLVGGGWFVMESLILAQDERWRRA